MYITLYKKCILSKDYTEVFDCTARTKEENNVVKHYSFFSEYLDTLTKTTFEIEDVYITNEGSFNLPFTFNTNGDFFEYNYMRLSYYNTNEHEYRTTRYCFIDNIEIRNDIAIVSYTTDIWHSFSEFMTIRNSYLSRSRLLTYLNDTNVRQNISPYNLPVEYDGNNNIEFDYYLDGKTTDRYNIICEIQLYKTAQAGQVSKRNSFYVILKLKTEDRYYFSKEEVMDYLQIMEMNMADSQGARTYVFNAWYQDSYVNYQFDNIYVLPKSFGIESLVVPNQSNALIEININNPTQITQDFNILGYKLQNVDEQLIGTTIVNAGTNFKQISIGTYTNQYPLIINGTSFDIKLKAHIDSFNFNLFLDYQNQKIDITDNFNIIIPFNSILGEENAQRGMARSLKNINGIYSAIENAFSLGTGGKLIGSGVSTTTSIVKRNYTRSNPRKLTLTKKTSTSTSSQGNLGSSFINSITELSEANAPIYSSNKGTFINSQGLLNAYQGIVIYKINPDNEAYVNKMIDETGYISYYIGSYDFIRILSSEIETNHIAYNILKYDFINLYGDFSQNVADTLKEILLDGVKVWYSSSV